MNERPYGKGFHVAPDELERAAAEIDEIRAGNAAALRPVLDDLADAERRFDGWHLERALHRLYEQFASDRRATDRRMEMTAERLRQAAAAYRNGDGVAQELFWVRDFK